jgi:hypothetical protein
MNNQDIGQFLQKGLFDYIFFLLARITGEVGDDFLLRELVERLL